MRPSSLGLLSAFFLFWTLLDISTKWNLSSCYLVVIDDPHQLSALLTLPLLQSWSNSRKRLVAIPLICLKHFWSIPRETFAEKIDLRGKVSCVFSSSVLAGQFPKNGPTFRASHLRTLKHIITRAETHIPCEYKILRHFGPKYETKLESIMYPAKAPNASSSGVQIRKKLGWSVMNQVRAKVRCQIARQTSEVGGRPFSNAPFVIPFVSASS